MTERSYLFDGPKNTTPAGTPVPIVGRKPFYQNKPLTHAEALHWCGCPSCVWEIEMRAKDGPPEKPEFVAYIKERYPNTAHLMDPVQQALDANEDEALRGMT